MEQTIKDAKQLMSECAAVVPEDECLKIIFGADYFWNKWKKQYWFWFRIYENFELQKFLLQKRGIADIVERRRRSTKGLF